jgi:hypothetical protein
MNGIRLFLAAGLLAVLQTAPAAGAAESDRGFGSYSGSAGERNGRERDIACSCCRDCRAATRDIKHGHNGVPATNGCRDCCERCGPQNLPTDKQRIPERLK